MVYREGNALIRVSGSEKIRIEAFGKNSLRVRITRLASFLDEDWALLPQPETPEPDIAIRKKSELSETDSMQEEENEQKANAVEAVRDDTARMSSGKIKVSFTEAGKMVFEDRTANAFWRNMNRTAGAALVFVPES